MAMPINTHQDKPVTSTSETPAPCVGEDARISSHGCKVLVVEDDPTILRMYEKVLQARGYETTACTNAEDAWKIYSNTFYPIVMLDWLLLGMDGLTLCRKMRGLPFGLQSVILIITGNDQPEHLDQVLDAGADDYIAKPVNMSLLNTRLTIAEKRVGIIEKRIQAEEKLRKTSLELEQQRDWLEASMRSVEQVKKEWENTIDSLSEVVCLLDESGRIIRANMAIEHWDLRRVVDVRNTDFHALFHPQCIDPSCYLLHLWPRIRDRLKEGDAQEMEVKDDLLGSYLRMRFRPLLTGCGGSEVDVSGSYAVAIVEDISERKILEMRLEKAREQELQIGSRIQQALLFDGLPEAVEGLEISAKTVPSRHIDGDFYAFFHHHPLCLDLLVGDVMGKGVPAALIGAAAKNHFLAAISHLIQASPDSALPQPREIVKYVHAAMSQRLIELENFMTLCYARFDLSSRTLTFVDCGHTRTLHYRRRTGDCHALQGENMPLGFSEQEIVHQSEVSFDAGDLLLFYSDGVIEAKSETTGTVPGAMLEIFGEERLSLFLGMNSELGPAELTDRIRREVVHFSGSEHFSDDLTVIAVKIQDVEANLMSIHHRELEITSNLSHLAQVRGFLREVLTEITPAPLDEESTGQLELALVECTTNTIKHAYNMEDEQRIRIGVDLFSDRVVVRLY
ncbi:MAG: SpoIIE family protein phosphatase, partial [Planctomycetota bacterium]